MAGLMLTMEVRPCIVNEKEKALFHCWSFDSELFSGGVVANMGAIVELEDGRVIRVRPETIKFLDRKFEDYDWNDERRRE